MSENRDHDGPDARQHPHAPGNDPRGSGEPRDTARAGRDEGEQGGAPLSGDRVTEEQLEADTEVEEDALRALDPDDRPD